MRGKKAKLHKTMLKERNKPTSPSPVKQTTSSLPVKQATPAPESSLFSTLTQTMSQGIAFGAGSSMGHRAIDIVSGLWGNKEEQAKPDNTKTTTFNDCHNLKREFVACMQNDDHCNEVQSQYLECLDKTKNN